MLAGVAVTRFVVRLVLSTEPPALVAVTASRIYLPELELGTTRSAESAPAITLQFVEGTDDWAVEIAVEQLNHW
jgi:hypothetical protein